MLYALLDRGAAGECGVLGNGGQERVGGAEEERVLFSILFSAGGRSWFHAGAGRGSMRDRRIDALDVRALESPLRLHAASRRIAADQLRH